MKFNRVELIDRIQKRIDQACDRVVADAEQARGAYEAELARWWDGNRDKLRSELEELLNRDDAPIVYGDISSLDRYVFRSGTKPRQVDRADVVVNRDLLTLLDFLKSRDEPTISTYGLENVGLASALRMLHDVHARVAWVDDRGARRAPANR